MARIAAERHAPFVIWGALLTTVERCERRQEAGVEGGEFWRLYFGHELEDTTEYRASRVRFPPCLYVDITKKPIEAAAAGIVAQTGHPLEESDDLNG